MDVSVIMPAYNSEAWIKDALDSIISQRFDGSFEILVADDCSKDKTKEIIQEYHNRYPNIIKPFYRENNLGVSRNYFLLSSIASGEYLAFCDSDDVWTNLHKLQIQYDFLKSNREFGMTCSKSIGGQTVDYQHIDNGGGQ